MVSTYYAREKDIEVCEGCGKIKLDEYTKKPCDDGVKRCNPCGLAYEINKTVK